MVENILVTGGAGYIGSSLVNVLLNKKFKVCIVDNLSTGSESLIAKKAKFYKLNILSTKKLKKIIIKNHITTVFHLAAKLSVNESQKNPQKYYFNNVLGTTSLLESIKNTNVKKIIFSSTCAVYGNQKIVNENSRINPESIYGLSKYLAEICIKKFTENNSNVKYAILRYFNVCGAEPKLKIGPIQNNGQLFKNLAEQSIKKLPSINIFGNKYSTMDGTCVRDYIHVFDISQIHLLAFNYLNKYNKNLLINCGYGKGYSVNEIIDKFQKICKKKFTINFKDKRQGDIASITANNKKIKKLLKFKEKFHKIEAIIKTCIEWEKIRKENASLK